MNKLTALEKNVELSEQELIETEGGFLVGGLILVGIGVKAIATGIKTKKVLTAATGSLTVLSGVGMVSQSFR